MNVPSRISKAVVAVAAGAAASIAGYYESDKLFSASEIVIDITDKDLLPGRTGRDMFIDKFSVDDIERLLQDSQAKFSLEKLGYVKQVVALDLTGLAVDRLRVYDLSVQNNDADGRNNHGLKLQLPCSDNILPYYVDHKSFTNHPLTKDNIKVPTWLPPIIELAVRQTFSLDRSRAMMLAIDLAEGIKCKVGSKQKRSERIESHKRTLNWMQRASLLSMDNLCVEWVVMQKISEKLPSDVKVALPGQQYPGLGLLKPMARLMNKFAKDKDTIVNSPLYFHNAVMYSTMPDCTFLNPEFEGQFRTLKNDLEAYINDREHIGLAVVSRALFFGNVIHRPSGKRVRWEAMEQVIPLSDRAKQELTYNKEYLAIVEANTTKGVFGIDFGSHIEIPISKESGAEKDFPCDDICISEASSSNETADLVALSEIDTRPAT
ncbi:hypothetical protein SARC_02891 [Sphaeroforma arctica JP610]|uniref:Uncharacterized protein n=1 Tax=Sphaeroforma arctica JP610 TaxID=667725 RepID=A0A0L0G7L0_9EUKA|nr:hypothetical protein SARC_02891 [Sphaeroforma arctica JP610]KNC84909.1 hypothetical protein SARC_02891 [Sphaeroforma arctica JP610]|eukprot:XP_014158811.1 hypothetical protein SARC_02891 [Sphaeroforma arctica JP610]